MPIFEFVCSACGNPFEELVFGSKWDDVTCPSCGSEQIKKKMSTFASKVEGGASSLSFGSSSAASCGSGSV